MNGLCQDATLVIRAAGERTETLCRALAEPQVEPGALFAVRESPSAVAMCRVLEVGLAEGRPWTVELDADMLLRPNALRSLIGEAGDTPSDTFTIKGHKLDKLFGGVREGGVFVFRTSLLREALEVAPTPEEAVRPDTTLVERMCRRGYRLLVRPGAVTCVHDYEQYYRDIYRKAFVHARKHTHFIPYLLPMWKRLAEEDFDYQVAIWGARAGLSYDRKFTIDVTALPREIAPLLAMCGKDEKAPLDGAAYTPETVERIIQGHVPPEEFGHFEWLLRKPSPVRKLAGTLRRVGGVRIFPWLAGNAMKRAGERLEAWANQTKQ